MFKKITYLAISIAMLLLMSYGEAKSQGTPMPVPTYQTWGGYYYYLYGYFFTAPVNFWIVRAEVLVGPSTGNQSIEIYRMTQNPSYCGQFFWGQANYPYTPGLVPLWSVRNSSISGPININQGSAYPSGTIQDIYCTAGTTYYIHGNRANYYSSMGSYGYGFNSSIAGIPVTLWGGFVYNFNYMYNGWSDYGYMYRNCYYYVGRTQIYYMLPCYIYVTQTTGGTIAPGATYGPFKPGTNVNLDYTVTPVSGKHIVDVTLNGVTVGTITRPVHTQHFGIVNTTQTLSATYGNKIVATGYGASLNPTGTSYFVTGSNPSYLATPFPGAFISTITATGDITGVVNVPVLNGGAGQTIALGQPGYPFGGLNEDWTLDVVCMMNLFTSVEPHGTINPIGSTDIVWGTQFPVQILPDLNYKVNNLYVDGFDVMDPTLPGYPKPGLDLTAWPVVTYTIDMSYSHTVHATFFAWEITPEVVGIGGTIEPPDRVRVAEHGQYPFVVTPDLDYSIDSVKAINLSNGNVTVVGNIPIHGGLQYLFQNIVNDWKLQALFKIDRFNVVVKNSRVIEGGKIFPTGTLNPASDDGLIVVNSGTDLNFKITPDIGWNTSDVLLDGVSQGVVTDLPLTTIRADHEVEARFQRISFTITATAGNHGMISLEGWEEPVPASGEYPAFYGENARILIAPDHGYKLSELKVDGNVKNPELEYSFYYVTDNHSITASFVPMNRYTITATAGTGGTISPNGAVSVVEGDNQAFTFTPNAGYEIADVLIDGTSEGQRTDYEFTNVTADHTIEIIFNPIVTYEIQCEFVSMQLVSGQPFDIKVICVDQATQQPINPIAPMNVTISYAGNQGTLSGTLQGTIPANDNNVIISGIVFTNSSGEANVKLISSASGLKDCNLTANFLAPEPLTQDGNIQFTNAQTYYNKEGIALTKATLVWTAGDGTKRLLVFSTSPITSAEYPKDGSSYTPNTTYGSGDAIGGAFVVFSNTGNTVDVDNLDSGTVYYVRLFGFNGDLSLANYNTNEGTGNPYDFPFTDVEDTYIANGFQVTPISPNPAFFDIMFNLNVSTASAFTIEVADLQGRIVAGYCNKKFYDYGNYHVAIPVTKLASGSYILKIYNGTDFAYQIFTIVR